MSSSNIPSFLILVVDVDFYSWTELHDNAPASSSAHRSSFTELLKNLIIFINAYQLLHRKNQLVVLSFSSASSEVIYPDARSPRDTVGRVHESHSVGETVLSNLLKAYSASD